MKLMSGKICILKQASKFVEEGDFAVMKKGDDHACYLLKLMSSLYETKWEVTNDYKHSFPPFYCVAEGSLLEVFKEIHDSHLYYPDRKRKAMISAYCVVGNCPTLLTTKVKKQGKM